MAKEIILPRQGNTVESCVIIEWKKSEGEKVLSGEIICEVETDKAVFQLESPADGVLLKTFFKAGDDVPVMTVIGAIGEQGEDVSALAPKLSGIKEVPEQKSHVESVKENKIAQMSASTVEESSVSPRARNLAGSKGVDTDIIQGTGPSGRVIERDVISALSGRSVSPGAAESIMNNQKSAPVVGSGIGGRVLVADLEMKKPGVAHPTFGSYRDIPVKGIRKVIAARMLQSMTGTAQCTLSSSSEASALLEGRELIKKTNPTKGFSNITLNDFMLFIVSRSLVDHRYINSHFLGEIIREFESVNLGFAVDTQKGLMVPVIRNANQLDIVTLSNEAKRLTKSCMDGSVKPDELNNATFTISNLGALGIESFTPVLNPPETGILGICCITNRPVSKNNLVAIAPFIGLSLTFNHQAVDGAPAARFLKAVSEGISTFNIRKLLGI